MTARLTSRILVQALIRRVQQACGFAAIMHKGDENSGALLLELPDETRRARLFERVPDYAGGTGRYLLAPVAERDWGDTPALAAYVERRLRADPDLWHVELDIANPEQLVAETILND